ncbi:MAG: glycosyltransferase [Rhodobiaceae bacterium]|nr:glycosyltransferase [Rhodobiaceae bacterium]
MSQICNKYHLYPPSDVVRIAEGGLRLRGEVKNTRYAKPLVSIITVCRNAESTIEACIRSVIDQTYSNIEYIIIDGASEDDTINIIKSYDKIIDYYISEKDDGIYHAMNKGLELSSGDYIIYLNSDDTYVKNCIDILVNAINYSGCDFVGAQARYINKGGGNFILRDMPFNAACLLKMTLRHETLLIPARLYNQIGSYNPCYRIIADREFVQRLYLSGFSYYEVPKPLLNFNTGGVSHVQRTELIGERRSLLKDTFPEMEDGDAASLAALDPISGDVFEGICKRYHSNPLLLKALHAEFQDRRIHECQQWADHPIDWSQIWRDASLPEVTIILPIYSAEKTVSKTIESILAQSFNHFEVLCINDKAIDGSQSVIDTYADRDPRILTLHNEKNIGLGATRNRGVRAARGLYIFHIDPDDILPRDALFTLVSSARTSSSQITRGAFAVINQQGAQSRISRPLNLNFTLINTSLAKNTDLLTSTEGHWSALYTSEFAETVPYPCDLKMGQDSIFLVHAYCKAKTITTLPNIIYEYHVNTDSAMNTFNARKYEDEIRWRYRAYRALCDHGLDGIGKYLMETYWHEPFVRAMPEILDEEELSQVISTYVDAYRTAGIKTISQSPESRFIQGFLERVVSGDRKGAQAYLKQNIGTVESETTLEHDQLSSRSARVAFIATTAEGGAGIAMRRIADKVGESSICETSTNYLFFRSELSGAEGIAPREDLPDCYTINHVRGYWLDKTILSNNSVPKISSNEIFTNTDAIADWKALRTIFKASDVAHLHWVSGVFDYENIEKYANENRGIVWTLHDMNPFTGGCHYSEGCTGFQRECYTCPMLPHDSRLAHEAWNKKKQAFEKIDHLHIVTPSKWLADRAKESSLLGDRPVHIIPNVVSADVFKPMNPTVARINLGLPLDKKLLLFGADNLSNRRKGGDLLEKAIAEFAKQDVRDDIEIVLFGGYAGFQLPYQAHFLGKIEDEVELAKVYSAVDALIFPSREENAPLIVAEALLCGTPVISFPVGNVTELVDHENTGYIAEFENVKSLANGIKWAINSDSGNKIKRSLLCRYAATQYYNEARSAKQYQKIYRELIDNNSYSYTQNTQSRIGMVTPCLNMVDTIDSTIASVVNQKGDFSVRYHVQDGGSTDGTLEKLKEWGQALLKRTPEDGPKIVFSWTSESDAGMYDAISLGFDRLNANQDDFIGWINADDLILPGTFAKIAAIAQKNKEIEWIGSHTYNIKPGGELNCSRQNPTPTAVIREGLCDGEKHHWYHLQQEGSFFRKYLWDECRDVLTEYKYAGDWALWREFAKHTEYYQSETPLGVFRIRENQISTLMREKYNLEIENNSSEKTRNIAFDELYKRKNILNANLVNINLENNSINKFKDNKYVVQKFNESRKYYLKNILSPYKFEEFTYAKNIHWSLFDEYSEELYGSPLNPTEEDLKRYQDLLAYAFIKENIPLGSRLLEIGGGVSRILDKLSDSYECWNIDKLEGIGNGPKRVDQKGVRLVRDYIGNESPELSDNYFDFIFSISVLEHVPQDDERLFEKIINDMQRVAKTGAYSLHLCDVVIKDNKINQCNAIIKYIFDNVRTINKYTNIERLIKGDDVYFLDKEVYDRIWKKYTKQSYQEFGKATSINILWKY